MNRSGPRMEDGALGKGGPSRVLTREDRRGRHGSWNHDRARVQGRRGRCMSVAAGAVFPESAERTSNSGGPDAGAHSGWAVRDGAVAVRFWGRMRSEVSAFADASVPPVSPGPLFRERGDDIIFEDKDAVLVSGLSSVRGEDSFNKGAYERPQVVGENAHELEVEADRVMVARGSHSELVLDSVTGFDPQRSRYRFAYDAISSPESSPVLVA